MTKWRRNETDDSLELVTSTEMLGAVRRVDGSTDIEVFLFDAGSTNRKLFFGNGLDDKDMKDVLIHEVWRMLTNRKSRIDKILEELREVREV